MVPSIIRRLVVVALVALVALALGVTVAPDRAVAEPTRLRLSLDGRTWSSHLERPLFSGDRVLVPGDEDSVSFWVRNDSAEDARLSLELTDVRGDLRLGSQLGLTARVDEDPVALDGTPPQLVLPPAGADPALVRLVVRLLDHVGDEVKGGSVSFRLRVGLAQQPGNAQLPAGLGDLGTAPSVVGALAGTGGTALGLPALGLVLVATATGLIRRNIDRRRR